MKGKQKRYVRLPEIFFQNKECAHPFLTPPSAVLGTAGMVKVPEPFMDHEMILGKKSQRQPKSKGDEAEVHLWPGLSHSRPL
jgi:hypothetical protein